MHATNLAEKLSMFSDYFAPRTIGQFTHRTNRNAEYGGCGNGRTARSDLII
jgi:hypothetical protein